MMKVRRKTMLKAALTMSLAVFGLTGCGGGGGSSTPAPAPTTTFRVTGTLTTASGRIAASAPDYRGKALYAYFADNPNCQLNNAADTVSNTLTYDITIDRAKCQSSAGTPSIIIEALYDALEKGSFTNNGNLKVNIGNATSQPSSPVVINPVTSVEANRNIVSANPNGKAINTLAAIINDAGTPATTNYNNLTTNQKNSLIPILTDSIMAWDPAFSTDTRRLTVKSDALSAYHGLPNTESDVRTVINNLIMQMNYHLGEAASTVSGGTVTQTEMTSTATAYDNVRSIFISSYIGNGVNASRTDAFKATQAIMDTLAYLGDESEGTADMAAILDKWVTAWPNICAAGGDLDTALKPLGMDDPTKTCQLMALAKAISLLPSSPSDSDITNAFTSNGFSAPTAAKAIEIYHKAQTQTCPLYAQNGDANYSIAYLKIPIMPTQYVLSFEPNGTSCVSDRDIVDLMVIHYGKPLPKLEAFINNIENWFNNNKVTVASFAVTGYTGVSSVYSKMKTNPTQVGPALDTIGLNNGIVLLAINIERVNSASPRKVLKALSGHK